MDASPITQALILFAVVTVATRYVLTPLARAGDGIATLFGPQNHTLGWPRGVQESDEPWAWRTPRQADGDPPAPRDDQNGDPRLPGPEVWIESCDGTFMVPVASVASIRVGLRRH